MKVKILFITFIAAFFITTPTFAHTDLISVDPTTDQVMLTLPPEIKLTFGEPVIADGTFASVTTSEGSVSTTVKVETANVFITIPENLVGPDITIAWKTVASDGHPLSGDLVYKLAEARTQITEEEIVAIEEPMPINAPLENNSSNISWLQWLALGISIGIAITFFLKMRKK